MKKLEYVYGRIFWSTLTVFKNQKKVEASADYVEVIKTGKQPAWYTKTFVMKWPKDMELIVYKTDDYGDESMNFCFNGYLVSINKDSKDQTTFIVKHNKRDVCKAYVYLDGRKIRVAKTRFTPEDKIFFEFFTQTKLFRQFKEEDQEEIKEYIRSLGES